MAGIELYSTHFVGIGGSIKEKNEDFKVIELLSESISKDISKFPDTSYRFPLLLLKKKGVDSNHAIMEIFNELGTRIRVLGIKDAKAVTMQYATCEGNKYKVGRTRHTSLSLAGYTKHSIKKSHIMGNQFEISITNPSRNDISDFITEIRNIPNYYGLQRFGSERLVTHLVGREIVRRNFKKAAELLLSYTTEYDSEKSREIRHKSLDPKNYPIILKHLPKGMDIEYQLMNAFVNGKEPISALRSISINIRRLFIHAYQSYIFNRCLSNAVLGGENILSSASGDLCFEIDGPLTFGKIRKFSPSFNSNARVIPALRLVGYSFQPGN